MSFVDQHHIQSLMEEILAHLWMETLPNVHLTLPFKRLSYAEAIDKVYRVYCLVSFDIVYCLLQYGSDKPNTTFEWKVH